MQTLTLGRVNNVFNLFNACVLQRFVKLVNLGLDLFNILSSLFSCIMRIIHCSDKFFGMRFKVHQIIDNFSRDKGNSSYAKREEKLFAILSYYIPSLLSRSKSYCGDRARLFNTNFFQECLRKFIDTIFLF